MASNITRDEAMRELARRELARRRSQPNTMTDMAKGALSGAATGIADLADAMPLANLPKAIGTLAGINVPNVREGLSALTGGASEFEPQTTAGDFAQTAGEFLPNAATPGGLLRRGAMVLAPATASEGLGKAFEDTDAEGVARIVGGIAGTMTAAGWGKETLKLIKSAAKNAQHKTGDAMKAEIKSAYEQMRLAGFVYDATQFNRMLTQTKQALLDKGFHPSVTAKAHGIIDDLAKNPALDFGALDAQSSGIGKTMRSAFKQGDDVNGEALSLVKDALDNFATHPVIRNSDIPFSAHDLAQMRASARSLVLRQKKAETVEAMIELADASTSGFVVGLNQQIAKELRKGNKGLFNAQERELLKAVQSGKQPWQKLPFIFGAAIDPTGFGGVAITGNAVERQLMEGAKRGNAANLARAMRNENMQAERINAKREQEAQALRRLIGIGTAVTGE